MRRGEGIKSKVPGRILRNRPTAVYPVTIRCSKRTAMGFGCALALAFVLVPVRVREIAVARRGMSVVMASILRGCQQA